MLVNADIAEHMRLNVAVPLLFAIVGLVTWPRRPRVAEVSSDVKVQQPLPPRKIVSIAKAA
jgi:hypothetical protein